MTSHLTPHTGCIAAIITARQIGSMPFETSEGNKYSQPANDVSTTRRIVPTLTEETHLGNNIDLFA
jgi:hypothetical protein